MLCNLFLMMIHGVLHTSIFKLYACDFLNLFHSLEIKLFLPDSHAKMKDFRNESWAVSFGHLYATKI